MLPLNPPTLLIMPADLRWLNLSNIFRTFCVRPLLLRSDASLKVILFSLILVGWLMLVRFHLNSLECMATPGSFHSPAATCSLVSGCRKNFCIPSWANREYSCWGRLEGHLPFPPSLSLLTCQSTYILHCYYPSYWYSADQQLHGVSRSTVLSVYHSEVPLSRRAEEQRFISVQT